MSADLVEALVILTALVLSSVTVVAVLATIFIEVRFWFRQRRWHPDEEAAVSRALRELNRR